MASLLFPDSGTRMAVMQSGRPAVGPAGANAVGYLYADEGCTTPAEAYVDSAGVKGALLPLDDEGGRRVVLNGFGEQPDYWGPADGTDQLWIRVNGIVSAVYADSSARIRDLAAGKVPSALVARNNLQAARRRTSTQYVNDFIPAGTDTATTNCSPYMQQAIDAAGVGGTVVFNGRYRCDTELQLGSFQTVEGSGLFWSWSTAGALPSTNVLDFSNIVANPAKGGEKVGFRLGLNNIFRNLLIQGPGHNVAGSRGIASDVSSSAPHFHGVHVHRWEHGMHLDQAYYSRLYECEFQYCGVGLWVETCYNLHLFGAKFTCLAPDSSSMGVGIYVNGAARPLVLHGGSIEFYSTAIKAASNSQIILNGVYFESTHASAVDCVGVDALSISGTTIDAHGCMAYLHNHKAWIDANPSSNMTIRGSGNKFVYAQVSADNSVPAPTVPFAYNMGTNVGDVRLSGDDWREVFFHTTNQASGYTNNLWTSGAVLNYEVQFPLTDQSNRHLNHYIGRNLVLPAGRTVSSAGLRVFEGSNAKQGVATLVGGTVTVANTSVTAASRIMLTVNAPGGTVGTPYVSARVAGASFTISSTSGADTSTVAYQIFEPA